MASKNYIFYKIFTENSNEIYIGSTADFKSRKSNHKSQCNNENNKNYNYKIYQTIRANGGWNQWKMIQIGKRDNITKRDAEQIEEEYRLDLKATMNTCRAYRSPEVEKEYYKEYRENNKEDLKEYIKEYRENNKEKIKEQSKEYYQNNKEDRKEYIREYYQNNKEKIKEHKKEYRENNKEDLKEYRREYRENNKEKLNEKHECECGGKFTIKHKSTHEKSKRHCEYINRLTIT